MLDFVTIKMEETKKGIKIYPEFIVKRSRDLMIRGKAFYAVWDEEAGFWSRNEDDIQRIVDRMISEKADEIKMESMDLKFLKNFSSNKWTEWQKYCKSLPDNFRELDENLVFSNQKVKKTDYITRQLLYPLVEQEIPAYDEMMSVLYTPEEREKIEWAIGAIISGESKEIQKFIVLYGGPGTGKSTVLNIIQDMFPGYCSVFDSRALGSGNSSFALEAFRNNPLIAIQHDGDLSRIEDNTKLNSIVSHEDLIVNEKFKSTYSTRFNSFLFMGTNKPVKITDSKSGILRRLIDVTPTGNKIPRSRYQALKKNIEFEYSGIAWHCLDVFKKLGSGYYDSYVPVSMIGKTNVFYNFIEDNYELFDNETEDGLCLSVAWRRYKEYCDDAKISYPLSKYLFKDELKNYYREFKDRHKGQYSVYIGFLREKFEAKGDDQNNIVVDQNGWLYFDHFQSEFDDVFRDCPAQYANTKETPNKPWSEIGSVLSDLDTAKLHYVKVPLNHIVIDFDLKDQNGNKSYERNVEAASKWPQTYAELSKSGSGVHLHYFYQGDVESLSRLYAEDIEIKVFKGNSSLRRMLTLCNDIPIATISSGLPQKEVKNMTTEQRIQSEKGLRTMIIRNLRKEIHPGTKPSIDFIHKILEDAYKSGMKYDVRDMRSDVQTFAMGSTHQADYCMRLVSKMKFCSEEENASVPAKNKNIPIVFFDCEVFPNLFVLCWKKAGPGNEIVRMINPLPSDVEDLTKFRLVGFNNRNYDNHILYGRMMGYSEEQLFKLSQRIIVEKGKDALFREANNLSYTDIYDFLSAQNKMSLKKWEIKLGIHHQELGLPWDKPVDKSLWNKVADYCCNDVIATEAVWDANQSDWVARVILAKWAGMTENDTTNNLTIKIIIGDDPNPQSQYIYPDLSKIFPGYEYNPYGIDPSRYDQNAKIIKGRSIYKGQDPGEGGRAIGYPGIYYNVPVLDVESMHPSSIIVLELFGKKYTETFASIVMVRKMIKHKDYERAKAILPPDLHEYLNDPGMAKNLSTALKTAINSVYGLTSAAFPNKLRDPRNVDNVVAKYGALFMLNLEEEVAKRGRTVVHVKTDSIKIANGDPEIIQFVKDYGKKYGFTFQHEATYSKICLVNDAVYIAKVVEEDGVKLEKPYWTATGTQFQVPYVFKTLFSKEPIEFEDLCETKSVTTALYLDFNEDLLEFPFDEDGRAIVNDGPNRHDYRFIGKVGCFCPMKPGAGGGILLREKDGKYYAATNTKNKRTGEPFRWMESEMVRLLGKEDQIDRSYYDIMVEEAIETINKYGDFERFVSDDDEMDWMRVADSIDDEVPFDEFVGMNPPER